MKSAQDHGEAPESIYGLVDWMRDQDVKVGRMRLVHSDGEAITLLIGRANRAEDLDGLYETLDPEPVIDVTFYPPVKLPKEAS